MEIKEFVNNLPLIETDRLILRKINMHDIDDMYEYANDNQVTKYVTWPTHINKDMTKNFIKFVINNYKKGLFPAPWGVVCKKNNKLIGTVDFTYINFMDSKAEIGYALAKDYWGNGFMTEAVTALLRLGFENLKLNRIEARCRTENIQSARVMEKNGMIFEGILRQHIFQKDAYYDVKIYSILKEEWILKK